MHSRLLYVAINNIDRQINSEPYYLQMPMDMTKSFSRIASAALVLQVAINTFTHTHTCRERERARETVRGVGVVDWAAKGVARSDAKQTASAIASASAKYFCYCSFFCCYSFSFVKSTKFSIFFGFDFFLYIYKFVSAFCLLLLHASSSAKTAAEKKMIHMKENFGAKLLKIFLFISILIFIYN